METPRGKGFILMRNGELVAASFEDKEGTYSGDAAVRYIMNIQENDDSLSRQNFIMRPYTQEDYAEALEICGEGGFFIGTRPPLHDTAPPPAKENGESRTASCTVDEGTLHKIMSQPGVIAVSAFYEGFPVLSLGEADFEHVAARAEDFLRAGTRIAMDMDLGQPDQMILETTENKFIIVPCGDLFLCIITRSDAQLGLMRVLLRSIQNEVKNGVGPER